MKNYKIIGPLLLAQLQTSQAMLRFKGPSHENL
jgi:hypothetical protein